MQSPHESQHLPESLETICREVPHHSETIKALWQQLIVLKNANTELCMANDRLHATNIELYQQLYPHPITESHPQSEILPASVTQSLTATTQEPKVSAAFFKMSSSLLSADGLSVVYKVYDQIDSNSEYLWLGVQLEFTSVENARKFKDVFNTLPAQDRKIRLLFANQPNVLKADIPWNTDFYRQCEASPDLTGQCIFNKLETFIDLKDVTQQSARADLSPYTAAVSPKPMPF